MGQIRWCFGSRAVEPRLRLRGFPVGCAAWGLARQRVCAQPSCAKDDPRHDRKDRALPCRNRPETPCLVVDLDVIAEAYGRAALVPSSRAHLLRGQGEPGAADRRDARPQRRQFRTLASRGEIELCLANGIAADRLSFGNTIKKEKDIAFAYQSGLRLFAFDSAFELDKLARAAPGAQVFCRILVACEVPSGPLSRKFGCAPEMAVELLRRARELGSILMASPSMSAHSRPTSHSGMARSVGRRRCFRLLAAADIELRMVNVGGRVPGTLPQRRAGHRWLCAGGDGGDNPAFGNHSAGNHRRAGTFAGRRCRHHPERGRADREKGSDDGRRWVYLDVGKFTASPRRWMRASSTGSRPRDAPGCRDRSCSRSRPATAPTSSTSTPNTGCARPRGRRQGRDPVDGCLYRELCLGRVQRLLADPRPSTASELEAGGAAAALALTISCVSLHSIASAKSPNVRAVMTKAAEPPITLLRYISGEPRASSLRMASPLMVIPDATIRSRAAAGGKPKLAIPSPE